MLTPVADFSLTTSRDITWAAQRARLLGTLTQLKKKGRNGLATAVTETASAVLGRPVRGAVQFAIGEGPQGRFIEASIIARQVGTAPPLLDDDSLAQLVDEVLVEPDATGSIVVRLRQQVPSDGPAPGPEDLLDWSTILATRTTDGALVESQKRLREMRAASGAVGTASQEEQMHEVLALVASTTDNSVVVMDSEGTIEWVNDSFARMSGYELSEVSGKPYIELLSHPSADPSAERELHSALRLNHGVSLDLHRRKKDGSPYWELLSLSPVFDAEGEVSRWVAIGADITARRKAEDALSQAKATAEAASNAKSDFLANMSHEIRTPMNAVMGMTDLALATNLTPEQREYLSIVRDSAHSLMGLLNDILDLSKIEAGKLLIDAAAFDVTRLLQTTLRPFVRMAATKAVDLTWAIQPDTPVHVIGDATRLRQILVNLVSNAVKFTGAGEIRVNVESQWESGDEASLHFSVSDTGIGMDRETLNRVFDAFTQADSSISREYGGTGLGLTISARLADLLGGRIWVQSQQGKGSTFHVAIPFQKAAQATDPIAGADTSSLQLSGEIDAQEKLRVLVADDNEANRILAQRVLSKRGHDAVLAEDGQAALDRYLANEFDVVVLDLQMPRVDGLAATEAIRDAERSGCRHTPIIALTAHAMPEDRQRCLRAGMDAYLSKPIDARELYTLVESLAELNPQHDAATPALEADDEAPFAAALARLEGDEELLREQMRYFLDESPGLLADLEIAVGKEDLEKARLVAHRLKGLAGGVDAGQACDLAGRVEAYALAGEADAAVKTAADLSHALADACQRVRRYLGESE